MYRRLALVLLFPALMTAMIAGTDQPRQPPGIGVEEASSSPTPVASRSHAAEPPTQAPTAPAVRPTPIMADALEAIPERPATPTTIPTGGVTATPELQPAPTVTLPPFQPVPLPVRLRIPALTLDAGIVRVGLDADGRMDAPPTYDEAAWYEIGPPPGQIGNAVIAGHLDSKTGPAIFYRLRELDAGDDIWIVLDDGSERRFIVAKTAVYPVDGAPLGQIFGPTAGRHLNLITCDGSFDRVSQQYNERLVIFAMMAEDSG